jgi:hypothetical protein
MAGDGTRSTTPVHKGVLADALRTVSPTAAAAVEAQADWRHQYPQHYVRLVELALATPAGSADISGEGLAALYRRMTFRRDGEEGPIPAAMAAHTAPGLRTVHVHGRGARPAPVRLEVPYRGDVLVGDRLRRRLDAWELAGVMEPSHGDAVRRVLANPDWLDLSDVTVALLGAGAELGPMSVLSKLGATLAVVDAPVVRVWERILRIADRGCGKVMLPLHHGPPVVSPDLAARAGADLVAATPEVRTWLAALPGPLVLGSYAYADGATHVRVNTATDAIAVDLIERRGDVTLAYLITPTNVFAVPREAADAARRAWAHRPALLKGVQGIAGAVSRGGLFQPNIRDLVTTADGWRGGIVDSLVVQQGPNYALAKRLQHWRAVVARSQGVRVSANVAPPSATWSVVKNPALAAAYAGAARFGLEVFEPTTANALMAALLVDDLRYDGSFANPATRMRNGLELFMQGANHGGLWRSPYSARSALSVAGVLGYPSVRRSPEGGPPRD